MNEKDLNIWYTVATTKQGILIEEIHPLYSRLVKPQCYSMQSERTRQKEYKLQQGIFFLRQFFSWWELSNIWVCSTEKLWSLHYLADIKFNGTLPWESLSKVLLLRATRWASWPQDQPKTLPQHKSPHNFEIPLFLKENFSSVTGKTWKQLSVSL